MSGSVVLLNLAGAVALLLFATRMVRTGVERAYGDVLRHRLRSVLRNPILAVGAGALLAICLQSATAVSILVGSFTGAGIVGATPGLLSVLGADLGSSLVVKLLSFDLSLLVPVCLLAGTSMFMATERREWRQLGHILVGVGLLLLSLRMIGQASEPLRESEILPVVINYLSGDPITAFLLAAVMTWLFHSSVAAILLVCALAARGLVPIPLGLVLILGANLGGGVIAVMLSRGSVPRARIVPLGNLIMRTAGAVIGLAVLVLLQPPLGWLGAGPVDQLVHFHIAFNVALVIAGAPFAHWVSRLAESLTRTGEARQAGTLAGAEVSALDEAALAMPTIALANATREVVRVCGTVELMLMRVIELYEHADQVKIDELAALDDRVDRKHAAIKLYLAKLTANPLTEAETLRCQELLGASIRLEQVGDIIVRNLLAHVQKKLDRGLTFTDEGWRELVAFHHAVLINARLAFNVVVSRDAMTARQLVQEKDRLRTLEKQSSQSHFDRLREGTAKSLETSSIHLDTIRDLKQINSLLAAMAYPVLEEAGLLTGSRLRAV
ncbi:Na/Pi cotransporter family protein [Pseudaminobacter sp. 19-2017]|uniref:Na/Pi cotransporter family protein n=1 Tax=Pseudaminobacter soli (ex Zhang et al. 2022) TaxID=2831468 RepID=A0A942E4S3_9HYPH|nr:Na/Pi cotransporter family protein [Pseudaminobacter soli]MBS3650966.1 Na/Pi cotransporter family protein [Pseudaminobacter soli]